MTTVTPNAQRLLRVLATEGPAYRADLARTLDVSRATVTNLANGLRDEGWIEEPNHEPGALKNLIGTSPRLGVLASVMFHLDTCTVSLSRIDGRVLSLFTLRTASTASASDRIAAGAGLLDRLLREQKLSANLLRAIHLAVDTQMDAQTGDIYAQRASSRWYGVNPKQFFESRFGVPLYLQNTARLEGLAEYLWGAGTAHSDILYVDVSYGVTSGHIVNGIISSGARGGSGEIGHVIYDWNGPLCTCGNSGCLMQYASVPALLRDYQTATGAALSWDEFCSLAKDNDRAAAAVARRAARALGRVLVNTCHLVDPGAVVLSGEVVRCLPAFIDETAASMRAAALPLVARNVEILRAELTQVHAPTARAGIESLRRTNDVVASVTNVAQP